VGKRTRTSEIHRPPSPRGKKKKKKKKKEPARQPMVTGKRKKKHETTSPMADKANYIKTVAAKNFGRAAV